MELYEIVKTTFTLYNEKIYIDEFTVVTSSMDKEMIDKMIEIYLYNKAPNEKYDIRVLRMPEVKEN